MTIGVAAQACGGSADPSKTSQISTQVNATGGSSNLDASWDGTTGTTIGGANTGGSVTAIGGFGTTHDFAATGGHIATGGTAVTGGSGPGGASTLQSTGGQPSTTCPSYAPNPGNSCNTGTVCTYSESSGSCVNPRTTRAQCDDSRWVVEVPMGCAQDVSKGNCAIDGTWRLETSGEGGGVRGIPYDTSLAISHDAAGQYYVSQRETSDFSGFRYTSQACKLQAEYHYETIIPPPNGSTCGLVSTDCELEIEFSNGAGNGTLTCIGHPNTCVGVYGGTASLEVRAIRVQS